MPVVASDLETIFITAHRELRPETPVPEIHAEFFPFAGLNHTIRRRSGRIMARVSDVLDDAPSDVVTAVAAILLSRLYRQRVDSSLHDRYRRHILDEAVQERAHAARRTRGRATRHSAVGDHVDLDVVFDRLNAEFFSGNLARPKLTWSQHPSRRRLGNYDAARSVLSISRIFDSPDIPAYVLDYILFHEMLHMKLRTERAGSRLITHSREFRATERAFPSFPAARSWLDEHLNADRESTNLGLFP